MLCFKVFKVNSRFLKRMLWTVELKGDDLIMKECSKKELIYPNVWLRDNCQCPYCFHKTAHSRIIEIEEFDFTSKPLKAIVENSYLDVSWSDNHHSQYSLSWLLDHQFTSQNHGEWYRNYYRPKQRPWSASDFSNILKQYDLQDILRRDEVLLQWLDSLAVNGVALVKGAKTELGQLPILADRVAYLKRTHYGNTFTVNVKPGTSNVAYLDGAFQLHADLPSLSYTPGVSLLHCISQPAGGGSLLSDGLSVCHWLRQNYPQQYQILATVPVVWEDIVVEDGRDYHTIHIAPVIWEDRNGELFRISCNNHQRSTHFNVPVEQVTPWYKALQLFAQRMHSPHCKVSYSLVPGDILTFDNTRLLHGRATFSGARFLDGCYLDWDVVYSRIRVLRKLPNPS